MTATKENDNAPALTIFSRVASIPLVSASLLTLNDTLSSNVYTRSSYSAAKEISSSAYKYAEPFQHRFAPFIVRADGIANKAVDVVQSRYPYPFEAKPEDITTYVQEKSEYVRVSAVTALDERVKTPAYTVAQGIDQVFFSFILCSLFISETHSLAFRAYRQLHSGRSLPFAQQL